MKMINALDCWSAIGDPEVARERLEHYGFTGQDVSKAIEMAVPILTIKGPDGPMEIIGINCQHMIFFCKPGSRQLHCMEYSVLANGGKTRFSRQRNMLLLSRADERTMADAVAGEEDDESGMTREEFRKFLPAMNAAAAAARKSAGID